MSHYTSQTLYLRTAVLGAFGKAKVNKSVSQGSVPQKRPDLVLRLLSVRCETISSLTDLNENMNEVEALHLLHWGIKAAESTQQKPPNTSPLSDFYPAGLYEITREDKHGCSSFDEKPRDEPQMPEGVLEAHHNQFVREDFLKSDAFQADANGLR